MAELCEKEVLTQDDEQIQCIENNRRSFLIGYYNYTVILTYIGMFVGFSGILLAIKGQIQYSLICLILAGFCDLFDGAIASTRKRTKQEKRFGIQIDSLSDLICFGVLPAIIVNSSIESKFNLWVCGIFVLSALIRLSYFNVDEEERQDKTSGKREYFKGLPVTSMAIILPLVYVKDYAYHLPFVLIAISLAFLLPVSLKKPNTFMKILLVLIGAFAFYRVFAGLL